MDVWLKWLAAATTLCAPLLNHRQHGGADKPTLMNKRNQIILNAGHL